MGGLLARTTGGTLAWRSGIIESSGGLWGWLFPRIGPGTGIAAITIGHAVLAETENGLHRTRAHERVHVEQFERWGPFFPLLYLGASLVAWQRGGHYYLDNYFEREARRLTS
jgi:hypothetical protein